MCTEPRGNLRFSSTISPSGSSTGRMADIPRSLISSVRPGAKPLVGEITVTSISNLNRGYWRASSRPWSSNRRRPLCDWSLPSLGVRLCRLPIVPTLFRFRNNSVRREIIYHRGTEKAMAIQVIIDQNSCKGLVFWPCSLALFSPRLCVSVVAPPVSEPKVSRSASWKESAGSTSEGNWHDDALRQKWVNLCPCQNKKKRPVLPDRLCFGSSQSCSW